MTSRLGTSRGHRPDRPLRVAVFGAGAIGGAVAEALASGAAAGAELGSVVRSGSTATEVDAAIDDADVVVEASSVDAAEVVIPRVTAAGKDVIVCSCGVFARHDHPRDLIAAGHGSGRALIPAGAVGGLDVLGAATLAGRAGATLRHRTIKSPAALGADPGLRSPLEIFRGTAREAALAFPRTSNASVALALATLGLDEVEVTVVADPAVSRTRHVVEWESPVGRYEMTFENALDPRSGGRTSAITAWSVTEVVASLAGGVGPGAVVVHGATGPGAARRRVAPG